MPNFTNNEFMSCSSLGVKVNSVGRTVGPNERILNVPRNHTC